MRRADYSDEIYLAACSHLFSRLRVRERENISSGDHAIGNILRHRLFGARINGTHKTPPGMCRPDAPRPPSRAARFRQSFDEKEPMR